MRLVTRAFQLLGTLAGVLAVTQGLADGWVPTHGGWAHLLAYLGSVGIGIAVATHKMKLWAPASAVIGGGIFLVMWAYLGLTWAAPPPPLRAMTGDLNIAVARFAVDSSSITSRTGVTFASSLANSIAALRPKFSRYHYQFAVEGPRDMPTLRGDVGTRVSADAAQLAEGTNATLVLFGSISTRGPYSVLDLDVFLPATAVPDAPELAGAYRAGTYRVAGNVSTTADSRRRMRKYVNGAVAALGAFALGLEAYNDASFGDARRLFAIASARWHNEPQRQLVTLFKGSVAAATGHLTRAESLYSGLVGADRGFARAWLGLAEVRLLASKAQCNTSHLATPWLKSARNALEQARSQMSASPRSFVLKLDVVSGDFQLCYAAGRLPGAATKALVLFDDVIRARPRAPDALTGTALVGAAGATLIDARGDATPSGCRGMVTRAREELAKAKTLTIASAVRRNDARLLRMAASRRVCG